MPYSETKQAHIQTIPFALSAMPLAGSVNITTTQGLASPDVQFSGVAVPAGSQTAIWSEDRQVELEPASATTIPVDTYVVVVTNIGQPGPIPADHHLIGHSYSLRAAGDLVKTPQALNLIWHTNTTAFTGIDPYTLDIFYWAGAPDGWIALNAKVAGDLGWLYTQTNLFGTYAVFAKPTWQARFDNLESVAATLNNNLEATVVNNLPALGLINRPGNDWATSQLIAPAYGLYRWGTLTFSATLVAPATLLTVDVLDQDEKLLLTNVSNGQSLADIDAKLHPALHLRAHLTATVAGATPGLHSWQVTWQPPPPVLISTSDGSVELGKIITVALTLAPPSGIIVGGVTLDARYDSTLLQIVGCQLHLTADLPGLCNAMYDVDQTNADGVRLSLITSATITTENTIAELSLRAIGPSSTPTQIDLVPSLAVDASGALLPVTTRSGQITITTAASGDVNCDNSVDRADADLILGYIVQLQMASTVCPPPSGSIFLPQCDINRDAVCDVRDVQMIVR